MDDGSPCDRDCAPNHGAGARLVELGLLFRIEELARAPGGAIYRFTPRRERL